MKHTWNAYTKAVCDMFAQLGAWGVRVLFASGDSERGCENEPGKLELRCFRAHVDQSCRSKVVASGVTVIYAEITFLHWPFPRSVRTSQGASNDPDSFPGELADFRYQPQFFTHTKESNPLPWLYWFYLLGSESNQNAIRK